MLGLFWRYNVPASLLDQLTKKNVKIIQQNKISLSKWSNVVFQKMSTNSWKLQQQKMCRFKAIFDQQNSILNQNF